MTPPTLPPRDYATRARLAKKVGLLYARNGHADALTLRRRSPCLCLRCVPCALCSLKRAFLFGRPARRHSKHWAEIDREVMGWAEIGRRPGYKFRL